MTRSTVRIWPLSILLLTILCLGTSFASDKAAAADFSGTWKSNVAGEGWVLVTYGYTFHADATLVLNNVGSGLSGSISLTISRVVKTRSDVPDWTGSRTQNSGVSGSVNGNTLLLSVAAAPGLVIPCTINNGVLHGAGDYTGSAMEHNTVTIDLRNENAMGLFDMSFLAGPAAAMTAIGAGVSATTSLVPLRQGATGFGRKPAQPEPSGQAQYIGWGRPQPPPPPGTIRSYPYTVSPGDARMADVPPPAFITPENAGGISIGGVGAHNAQTFDQFGRPLPPRDWPGPTPPKCPSHSDTIYCQAQYRGVDGESGSWYCPRCGRFPWGMNTP